MRDNDKKYLDSDNFTALTGTVTYMHLTPVPVGVEAHNKMPYLKHIVARTALE